jgi:membrane associated rhomboid family serine protease
VVRAAAGGAGGGGGAGTIRAVIPLYDNVPTRRFPVVTVGLIAVCVAVWVFELLAPAFGISRGEIYVYAGAIPLEISTRTDLVPGDPVTWWASLFTSMFLHGGWLHVIFNMLFLWIFGNNVEDTMGRLRFLVFYLLCGLAAAVAQVAIDPASTVPTIGASGAIAGVLGAYIVLFPRAKVLSVIPLFIFFPVIMVPAWVLLIIWFGWQLLQGLVALGAQTEVAFFAHVGGFVAGAALVWLFTTPGSRRGRMQPMY